MQCRFLKTVSLRISRLPTKRGKLYTYYVNQAVLKGTDDGCTVRRISAGEIEAAVMDQVRALLRQPEVVIGTWRAAQAEAPDLTEAEARDALEQLDPLWQELFPAEQARIVRSLVERVDVSPAGADIRLRLDGLAGLVRDLLSSPCDRPPDVGQYYGPGADHPS